MKFVGKINVFDTVFQVVISLTKVPEIYTELLF